MSTDEDWVEEREQLLVLLSLFTAYYLVVQDWAYAAAAILKARKCEMMSDVSMAVEYAAVGTHSTATGAVTNDEAAAISKDWWSADSDTRAEWADRLVYPDKRKEPAVRAWITGSPELHWFFDNALIVAMKSLLDTYVDQVLRLLYFYEANQLAGVNSAFRISENDRRELAAMAERVANEETEARLRDATTGSISVRLGRIGEKAGVRIRLDDDCRDALRRLTGMRNAWVHSLNQGRPELLNHRVVVRARGDGEGDLPTAYASMNFREAYAVCAAVAGEIHETVWRAAFPDQSLGFMANGLEQLWGVPSEFTLEVWEDPFLMKGLA